MEPAATKQCKKNYLETRAKKAKDFDNPKKHLCFLKYGNKKRNCNELNFFSFVRRFIQKM